MESSEAARGSKDDEECTTVIPQKENSTNKTLRDIYSSDSDDSDFDREYTCETCKKSFSGLQPMRQHQKSNKHIKAVNREKFLKEIDEDLQKLQDDSDDENSSFGYKPYTECEICKKEFSGLEPYRQHLRSKAHKKKKIAKKILSEMDLREWKSSPSNDKAIPGSDSEGSTESENSEIFECRECEKVFSGIEPYHIHMNSKLHRKKLKQKILIEELTADLNSGDGDEVKKSIRLSDGVLICKSCRVSFSGPENVLAHLKSRGHKEMQEYRKWKKEQKLQKEQEETKLTQSETESGNSEIPFKKEPEDSQISTRESDTNDLKSLNDIHAPSHEVESAISKTEESLQNEAENTILAYKSYKNYKKILNNLKSEEV